MPDELPPGQLLTDEVREGVLAYIREHPAATIAEAAEANGAKRWMVKRLIATEPDFAESYREARGYGRDHIRAELKRRAFDGVEEVTEKRDGEGALVERTTVLKRSDRLLLAMAGAYLPEFSERLEVTGAGGGPIELSQRGATLADVARVLYDAGALDGILGRGGLPDVEVSGAPALLAAAADGEPAAGSVPAAGQ